VFLTDFPHPEAEWNDGELASRWQALWAIRGEVTTALEKARKSGDIRNSLDSRVILRADVASCRLLESFGEQELAYLFIVSQVELVATQSRAASEEMELSIEVLSALGDKCARCWNHSVSVGSHADHESLCDRCYGVVAALS